jgi:uncharacterized membrane-anchored protein
MNRTKSAMMYSASLVAIGVVLILSGLAATHWFTRAIAYGMIGGGIAGFVTQRFIRRARDENAKN